MVDFITIQSNNPDMIYATKTDMYGGIQFSIGLNQETADAIRWVKEYKAQLTRESKAREEHESVRAAYEQYQTVLNLVLDQI